MLHMHACYTISLICVMLHVVLVMFELYVEFPCVYFIVSLPSYLPTFVLCYNVTHACMLSHLDPFWTRKIYIWVG
jgi:hypothetical protein